MEIAPGKDRTRTHPAYRSGRRRRDYICVKRVADHFAFFRVYPERGTERHGHRVAPGNPFVPRAFCCGHRFYRGGFFAEKNRPCGGHIEDRASWLKNVLRCRILARGFPESRRG